MSSRKRRAAGKRKGVRMPINQTRKLPWPSSSVHDSALLILNSNFTTIMGFSLAGFRSIKHDLVVAFPSDTSRLALVEAGQHYRQVRRSCAYTVWNSGSLFHEPVNWLGIVDVVLHRA
jgi:hypothetical protein